MTAYIQSTIKNGIGLLTLDRPKALNSLSLDMVRAITQALMAWRDDTSVHAVVIKSSQRKSLLRGRRHPVFLRHGTCYAHRRQRIDRRFFYGRIRAEPPCAFLSEALYRTHGWHRDGGWHGHRAERAVVPIAHRHRTHGDGDARSQYRALPRCRRQLFFVACTGPARRLSRGDRRSDWRRRCTLCRAGRCICSVGAIAGVD